MFKQILGPSVLIVVILVFIDVNFTVCLEFLLENRVFLINFMLRLSISLLLNILFLSFTETSEYFKENSRLLNFVKKLIVFCFIVAALLECFIIIHNIIKSISLFFSNLQMLDIKLKDFLLMKNNKMLELPTFLEPEENFSKRGLKIMYMLELVSIFQKVYYCIVKGWFW